MARTRATPAVAPPPAPDRVFKWRGGGHRIPAQVAGEELARLEVRPGQFHRSRDVLEAARDPASPLHPEFNWDDTSAAEERRLDQARHLIRSLVEVEVRHEVIVHRPVYYHVRDADGPKYVNIDRIKVDEATRQRAIREVLTLLAGIRRKYEHLTELTPVFDAIDDATRRQGGRG